MIKKITIATVLGAAVVSYISANLHDAPKHDSVEPALSNSSTASLRPAATAVSKPMQEIAVDDGTEVVLGLRVRKDRNCDVELKDYVTPTGEMFAAYSCTPKESMPPHDYAEYDNETLASMAYSDADAAALLGHRLIKKDTRKSYQLLIRASALDDGNIEHLAWLSDQAFGATDINGEPQIANLQRQYELAALAVRLGDDPGKTNYLRDELLRLGIAEAKLVRLDTRVDVLFQSMRDIQRTVVGEITIGGQGDV